MNSSQDWSEMLAGYVLGDLSPEEMEEVQRYLAQHPGAIAEVEALQTTLGLLPLGLPDVAAPPDLRDRVLAAAMAPTAVMAPQNVIDLAAQRESRGRSRPRSTRNWVPILGGVAAAMIAALGLRTYTLQQQVNVAQQEIASLQQRRSDAYRDQMASLAGNGGRTLTMQGTGPIAGASGKILIVPQQNRALLVVDNLPQPPVGQVYHLWAVVNGQKVSCIQFTPEQDGKVVMQIPANRWSQAVQVGVTLEPEKSSAMPSGEMVMQGQQI